jgi:glycosyltransferase involved in cell wall biosynthesis
MSRGRSRYGDVQVTAVIPTRDRWTLLPGALAAAAGQEGVRHEVVVIDDGSRDAPSAAVRRLLDRHPHVRLIRRDRCLGVAHARNCGIAEARGKWVAFLDDDDLWSPDHLSALLAAAESRDVGFAYSGRLAIDGERLVLHHAPAPDGLLDRLLTQNCIGTPSCAMATKVALAEAGNFDPSFGVLADWDLWLRLAAVTGAVAVDRATVAYRMHGGNMHLDIRTVLEEFDRLNTLTARRVGVPGLRLGDGYFDRWVARVHLRKDQNLRAAAWFLRSWRRTGVRRDLREALRAAARPARRELGRRRGTSSRTGRRAEAPPRPSAPPDEAVAKLLEVCATYSLTPS